MKGGEPIIHCDQTIPFRLQLNPQLAAQHQQKSTNPRPEKWPTKDME